VKKNNLNDQIICGKAIDFHAAKMHSQEAQHIQGTMAKNLTMWLWNWEHDLVRLGFATKLIDGGDIQIPKDQLGQILKFDKTCLSLNDVVVREKVGLKSFFIILFYGRLVGELWSQHWWAIFTWSSALGGYSPSFSVHDGCKI
jgi:hypothetical protein